MMEGMTAQLAGDYDPDDPVEILRVLPGWFHGQFLAEYDAAVAGARRPEQYRELHRLLRLWRLRRRLFRSGLGGQAGGSAGNGSGWQY
jgi:hypothetical protein